MSIHRSAGLRDFLNAVNVLLGAHHEQIVVHPCRDSHGHHLSGEFELELRDTRVSDPMLPQCLQKQAGYVGQLGALIVAGVIAAVIVLVFGG